MKMAFKLKSSQFAYVITAYVTLFCLGLLDNARGPFFADIMRDLQLNNWQGSLFYAVSSMLAYFTGVRVAHWAHRFGTINVLRMGQVSMGFGFAAIATAHSLPTLLIFCAAFGSGFGLINVAQNFLILESASGALRRRLFSGLHGMYAFASLIAPLICAELFRGGRDWRFGFIAFASTLIIAFGLSFIAKNHKLPKQISPEVSTDILTDISTRSELEPSMLKKYFWLLILISFYTLAEIALTTRLSLFLRIEKGFAPADAANWLAYFFVAMLFGRVVFLIFHFHWRTNQIILVSLVLSLILFSLGLKFHVGFLLLCGVTLGPIFGLCLDHIAELHPNAAHEAVSYMIAKSGLFIVTMHLLTGVLSDAIGIGKALALGPLYLLIASVALLKVNRAHRATARKPSLAVKN